MTDNTLCKIYFKEVNSEGACLKSFPDFFFFFFQGVFLQASVK